MQIRNSKSLMLNTCFLTVILAGLFLFAHSALAVDYTWSAGASGNWTTNTNWTPNGVPGSGAGDTVTIDTDYTVTLSSAPSNSLTSITLSNDAVLNLTGTTWPFSATTITLNNTSDIIVDEENTQGNLITISATTLTVASGATINANGTGLPASTGTGQGGTGSYNVGGACYYYYGGGGGYGGTGGNGNYSASGGTTYGTIDAPTDLGSGGGLSQGGAGGGAIRLDISGTLTNNGTISANGNNGTYLQQACVFLQKRWYGGGGSGGSIYATAGTLAGSGSFTANGGTGNSSQGGGGGGGRIYIEVGASSPSTACSDVTRTVTKGTGYASGGANGTNYCGALSGTLTSSKYNTNDAANIMSSIAWSETVPSGTNVKFQIRTAASSAGLDSASWLGPDCTSNTYYETTPAGETICSSQGDGTGDQWFQYRVTLSAPDVIVSPTLSDITITYVVNAPPEFDSSFGVTASQNSDGTVTIQYKPRDPDTTSGSITPNYVTPSFEYSTNGGGTWTSIASELSSSATTTKKVEQVNYGDPDNSYAAYTVTWTPKNRLDGTYTSQAQIRITLNDSEPANNTVSLASSNFALDVKDPTLGANPILVKATTTPATITLSASDDSSFNMKVGLASDLSDVGAWISYANSTTTSLAADPDTVYVQFKDAFSNSTTIQSATTPETPTAMMVQDTSNIITSEWRLFVAWKVSTLSIGNFGSYRLYRSTDGGTTYSLLNTETDKTVNYFANGSLTADSTYYYKTAVEDSSGNASYFSSAIQSIANAVQDAGEGGGGTPASAPVISSVSSSGITTQTADITWTTDKLSNSTVGYCVASCSDYTTQQGVASYVTSHAVTLTGLTPGTTYDYKVISSDIYSNTASSTGYNLSTNSGPQISGVSVIETDGNSAKITWNTNIAATGSVVYDTASPPSGANETGTAVSGTSRTIELTGLSSGTLYYFYVKSQDVDENWAYDYNIISGEKTYYTFTTASDATAPTISNIDKINIGATSAVITWDTDESATSKVAYGTISGTYDTESAVNSNLNRTHAVQLASLSTQTTYYFAAVSADGSGNIATSTEDSFTTLETQIGQSQQTIQQIYTGGGGGSFGVPQSKYDDLLAEKEKLQAEKETLEKKLNELKTPTGETVDKSVYDEAKQKLEKRIAELEKEILGIEKGEETAPEKLIKIVADKFNSLIKSFSKQLSIGQLEENIFPLAQTLEELSKTVPGPMLLTTPYVEITSNSAVISWETDKEANSIVAYATNEEYKPENQEPYALELGNITELVKEHRVTLKNLFPSTTYHYQIRSKSQLGAQSRSKDFTFTTKSELPRITNPKVISLDKITAQASWQTNIPADSVVKYTPYRQGVLKQSESKTQGKPDFTLSHAVLLSLLEEGTTYQIEILSRDAFSNQARETISFFSTTKDIQPPQISLIRTEMALFPGKTDRVQAIISYQTDEPSTTQVFYETGAGTGAKEKLKEETPLDLTLSVKHLVVITRWEPGKVYRFRAASQDGSGNLEISKDFFIMTPQKKATVLDLIIENFAQTFGWVERLGF